MTATLTSQFMLVGTEFGTSIMSSVLSKFGRPAAVRASRPRREDQPEVDIRSECQTLLANDLVERNQDASYELTEKGVEQARRFETDLKNSASLLERQISPTVAARNTFLIDLFLAAMKLSAGVFSGSVGLIADGADAAIDTVSASLVWLGMKLKRELIGAIVILLMMFITGLGIFLASFRSPPF